ncbi:MAG: 16S rRNA (adenine(1518)-N(6)/adenine(1519)-N(6))-dimethyltransferase, partial [Deltaproteobacteria bacterium]|nr:16S rRNA (adenine(1518)-N(6)/adenine(1519)-N(6))-dimethyltransferase [Deltaproteobacteria bacterium]
REVAGRLLAGPGTRAYGSLTVLHRLVVEVEKALTLEPQCFFPVPKVRSSFLRMRPLAKPLLLAEELSWVEPVVRAAFAQRRKTLVNALRGSALEPAPDAEAVVRVLDALGIDRRARAESLDEEQLLSVARALAPSGRGPA